MTNLSTVLAANGIGIMLLLVLLLSTRQSASLDFLDSRLFYGMVVFTILQCFLECAAYYIDGKLLSGYHVLALLINSALYIINILFAFLWTVYADYKLFEDIGRIRKLYPWVMIPALLIILGSLANLCTPVFFRITAENVYERTALYIVPYACTYLYLLYGVAIIYRYRGSARKYLFLPAVIFMIPILFGSLLQYFFYGLSLVWPGVAVALTSLYLNVQNEAVSTDALSGLYNRQYMHRFLRSGMKQSSEGHRIAGIMLDVDHFKQINDTYGHLTGDEAIEAAGEILKKAAQPQALAFRYAGDEFVLLQFVKEESQIRALAERVAVETEHYNQRAGKPFKLHFSAGCGLWQGPEDTIDSLLGRMDSDMYERKRKNRKAH